MIKDYGRDYKHAIDTSLPIPQEKDYLTSHSDKALAGAVEYLNRLEGIAGDMVRSDNIESRKNLFNEITKYLTLTKKQITLYGEANRSGKIDPEVSEREIEEAPKFLETMHEE